jgi:hypothetical protein
MAIKYTLSINNVTKKFTVGEFSDVIIDVSVSVNAYSEEYPQFTYSCGGQVQLNVEELDEDNFVSFENVDKDVVVSWLLVEEGVETVEEYSYVKYSIDNIQGRIDDLEERESISPGWVVTNEINQDVLDV